MRSQKPSGVTFDTSAAEVRLPRAADFIFMLPNEPKRRSYATPAQSIVACQLHGGIEPELCLTARMLDVYMGPPFLSRKEIEAVPADPEDGRTHTRR